MNVSASRECDDYVVIQITHLMVFWQWEGCVIKMLSKFLTEEQLKAEIVCETSVMYYEHNLTLGNQSLPNNTRSW